MSANPRLVIARTPDGTVLEATGSEGFYPSDSAGRGELVRLEKGLGEAIRMISNSVRDAVRHSGATGATIEFGLSLDARAGFIVTQGRERSSFTITLEWRSESES